MKKKTDPKAEEAQTEAVEQVEEEKDKDGGLTLVGHLLALRKTVVISGVAILVAFLGIFSYLIDYLMKFLTEPIAKRGVAMIYTAVSEALVTKFKVALVAAVVVAFPVIVWQIWVFIRPALYAKEKRLFKGLFFASVILFLVGIFFCYTAVYTLALDFFMVSGEDLAEPMLSVDKYISFLMGFILPFGIAFMMPVFLFITTRMGMTTASSLSKARKYVILGLAVMAAILTPPDVVSQVMLLCPMLLLYEVSILVARLTKPVEREEQYEEYE